jgi:hypothetical protein
LISNVGAVEKPIFSRNFLSQSAASAALFVFELVNLEVNREIPRSHPILMSQQEGQCGERHTKSRRW